VVSVVFLAGTEGTTDARCECWETQPRERAQGTITNGVRDFLTIPGDLSGIDVTRRLLAKAADLPSEIASRSKERAQTEGCKCYSK
jgi:hypothetical protein